MKLIQKKSSGEHFSTGINQGLSTAAVKKTRWWFQLFFGIFTPTLGEMESNFALHIFKKKHGVGKKIAN